MGRSSNQKALENRKRIVETANQMFRRFGVDNVSVADVMNANGMTVGGFYKHFSSKDALVAEAFRLAFERSGESWGKGYLRADATSRARSAELVRHYISNRCDNRRCPIVSFAPHVALDTVDEDSKSAYSKGVKDLFDKFVEGFNSDVGIARSITPPSDEAMVLFSAMVGARMLGQAIGQADWLRKLELAIEKAAVSATDQR